MICILCDQHVGQQSGPGYAAFGNSAQDLNDVMTSLKTLFDFKFVSLNAASRTVTLRGPKVALKAGTQFLGQMNGERPEVMLDLQVFQLDHTYAKNVGLHVPDNFNLYSISAAELTALESSSGQTLSAVIAQLESQQSSIFSQPLATFGGGITLMGLSLDQLSAELSVNP